MVRFLSEYSVSGRPLNLPKVLKTHAFFNILEAQKAAGEVSPAGPEQPKLAIAAAWCVL